MNSSTPEERRRPYDNRLREEQATRTRERILEAVMALLAEVGSQGVTMATIAARAGVSEPTIYRHFGSREGLHEAIDRHFTAEVGLPPVPPRVEDLPETTAALFARFQDHAEVVRAALRAGVTREMRERGRRARNQKMRELLSEQCAHLSAAEAKAVAAVYRVIISWETWETLTGEQGVEAADAARAAAWAVAAMNEKLARDSAARRRKRSNSKAGK
jgi:AcrR family transcriptional regulator